MSFAFIKVQLTLGLTAYILMFSFFVSGTRRIRFSFAFDCWALGEKVNTQKTFGTNITIHMLIIFPLILQHIMLPLIDDDVVVGQI